MQRNELTHRIEILDGTRIGLEKKLTELRQRRKVVYDRYRYYADLESTRVFNHLLDEETLDIHIESLGKELLEIRTRINHIKRDISRISQELSALRYTAGTRYLDSMHYIPNEDSVADIISYYCGGTYID